MKFGGDDKFTAMGANDSITIRPDDKDLIEFLERIRALGSAVIETGNARYFVTVRTDAVSDKGREFLARGGPSE